MSRLKLEYTVDGPTVAGNVRHRLQQLSDDDVSVSSPVSAGGTEVGLAVEEYDDGYALKAVVDGHEGDWTKTSTRAIKRLVSNTEGVHELLTEEGGYEPPTEDDDEDDGD